MTRIIWSPQSFRDLQSILGYIALDSTLYADLVVRRIVDSAERLARFTESGRVVPERADPNLREVIVRPYRVVYRLRGGAAEIVTVFHAARLFPRDLG